jgi:hypothetical protein
MAYNTRAKLQQEGDWTFTMFQPNIGSQSAFDSFCDGIITRCASNVKWRVGAALYGTADTLVQAILEEAELCLGMYYLLLASAAISDTSDNSEQQPAIAQGRSIRLVAHDYKGRYEELLAPYDTKLARARWARPAALTTDDTRESIPDFEQPVEWEAAG